MPGPDPGIHAVTSQQVEALVEWVAGSSPAMTSHWVNVRGLLQRLFVELLGAKPDIQPQHGAADEDSLVVDPRRASIVIGIVHLGNRRDVFVVGPKREAGAHANLLAGLERHGADEGKLVVGLGDLGGDRPGETAVIIGVGVVETGARGN